MKNQQAALDSELQKVTSPVWDGARLDDPKDFIREMIGLTKEYPRLLQMKDSMTTPKQRRVFEDVQNLMAGIDVLEDKGPSIFDDMASYKQRVFEKCAKAGVKYEDQDAVPQQDTNPEFVRICKEALAEYPRLNELYEKPVGQFLDSMSSPSEVAKHNAETNEKSLERMKRRQSRELDIAIRRSLALHQQLEILPDQIKNQMKVFYKGIARQAHELLQEIEASRAQEKSGSVAVASEEGAKSKGDAGHELDDIPMAIPVEDGDGIPMATPVPTAVEVSEDQGSASAPSKKKVNVSNVPGAIWDGGKAVVHTGAVGLGGINYGAKEVTKAALDVPLSFCRMLDTATGAKYEGGKRVAKGELYLVTDFFWLMNKITGGIFTITGGVFGVIAESSMNKQQRAVWNSLAPKDRAQIGDVKQKVDTSLENLSRSNSLLAQESQNTALGSRGSAAEADFTRG